MNELNPSGTDSQPTNIGRYEVRSILGRGGMGMVCKAIDPQTGRMVAVKTIDAEQARDEETLKRFSREAKSAMELEHPNIARIYGLEKDEKGRPFIVMEFVDGPSLEGMARGSADPPMSMILDYVIQTCRGLEAAHRRSIIHRDIKPSNLVVGQDGVLKIIDFGLAKSMWDQSFLTATGMVVGTPRYISPEQAMGRNVDHRSDIYSLGATLYELLTHQVPFDGDQPMNIMLKHINTPLTPPYMLNPKIPPDVNEIVVKMLAKDPSHRYQDYEPLIRDLESARIARLSKEAAREGRTANLSADSPTVLTGGPPVLLDSLDGTPQPQPRRSSYLTEGLVNVDLSDIPEPPPSRKWAYGIMIAVFLFIVLLALSVLQPPPDEMGQRESSWLAAGLKKILGGTDTELTSEMEVEAFVIEDAARITATVAALNNAVPKIIQWRGASPENRSATLRIRDLRAKGVLTVEETQDGWGNDFIISSRSGGIIIAPGRDGVPENSDDFIMTLGGMMMQQPQPLTIDEAKAMRGM